MILSDVSQRRFIVDSVEEVRRIKNISMSECWEFDYYEIEKDLYLITLTNTTVGDYFRGSKSKLSRLAKLDINDIKKTLNKQFNEIIKKRKDILL